MRGRDHQAGWARGRRGRRRVVWLALLALLVNLIAPLAALPAPAVAAALDGYSICHSGDEAPAQPADQGHHGFGEECPLCLMLGHHGSFSPAEVALPDAAVDAAQQAIPPPVPGRTLRRLVASPRVPQGPPAL